MKADSELVFHEIAGMFTLMPPGYELDSLAADIKKHGLREPILLYEGKIADGRNRYNACKIAKVTPTVEDFDGDEAELVTLLVSRNLHRRHLNESQRAVAAAAIVPRLAAAAKKRQQSGGLAQECAAKGKASEQAAALLNVSARSVENATKVADKADESVQQAVASGEVTITDAAKVADLPKKRQKAAVKKVRAGKAKTLATAADEDGGFEPSETYAIAKKLDTALGKCVRMKDQIKKIVGADNAVQALHDSLDGACKAVAVIMRKFKKAK